MKKSIAWGLLVILVTINVLAQSTLPQTRAETPHQPREKNVSELLEEVIVEAATLKLPENSVYVRITLARLLWKKDKERSRSLFKGAVDALMQLAKELNPEDEHNYRRLESYYQIRQSLLEAIAHHDVQFARETFYATRPVRLLTDDPYQEQGLEASFTSLIAQSDAKEALSLAKEILERGVSSNLTSCLYPLNDKDPKIAAELAGAILNKIRASNLLNDQQAFQAATSLLHITAQTRGNIRTTANNSRRNQLLDPNEQKELANNLVTLGLKILNSDEPSDQRGSILDNLKSLLPLLGELVPTQAAELKAKFPADATRPSAYAKAQEELNKLSQSGTVEQLLEASRNAPKQTRDSLIQGAVSKAHQQGKPDLAKQIINDYISHPRARRSALETLENTQFQQLLAGEKPEEALQAFSQIKNTEARVGYLFQIVSILSERGDKKKAVAFLEEIARLLGSFTGDGEQFEQWMSLASQYAEYDLSRSCKIMESIVSHLNEMVAAAAVIDRWEKEQAFHKGEMRFRGNSNAAIIVRSYSSTLSGLAKYDFDRAKSIADRFERSDIRMLIKLGFLQNLLPQAE